MASLNGVNYAIEIAVPEQKVDPVSARGKSTIITERYSIDGVVTDGDEIEGPLLPEGARIVEAKMVVNGSLGSGGKFKLGYRAGVDIDDAAVAEDDDALVSEVDAGGAAAQASMGASSAGLNKVVGKGGLRTFATCFETTDDMSSTPRELSWFVTVMLP
jgi:hypothetical protein